MLPIKQLSSEKLLSLSPIMPVIIVDNLALMLPLAEAMIVGGINVFEITLRTPLALEAISLLKKTWPQAIVGAGTVITPLQLQQCIDAGADFAVSPGFTGLLLAAGQSAPICLLPGIATAAELMQVMAYHYQCVKFFPAHALGGVNFLKSLASPFPDITFCPTGGINQHNFLDYLALSNVNCVGGSWIITPDIIAQKLWVEITQSCKSALSLIKN